MKLSQWAKSQGIHYNTAYNWFRAGTLPVNCYQTSTGTIIIQENQQIVNNKIEKVVIYARVSSHNKKDDLERQAKRCEDFCVAKGFSITKTYKEIASGMNDNRKQLWNMINEKPTIIVVENKDRLTRFGFNYLNNLLEKLNCKILVINQEDNEETDIIKDMISIVTSFCCRLYGVRRGHKKTENIKKIIEQIDD
jgi:predicted site-specific integrase-resolvase